jgi:hypothetical protein
MGNLPWRVLFTQSWLVATPADAESADVGKHTRKRVYPLPQERNESERKIREETKVRRKITMKSSLSANGKRDLQGVTWKLQGHLTYDYVWACVPAFAGQVLCFRVACRKRVFWDVGIELFVTIPAAARATIDTS